MEENISVTSSEVNEEQTTEEGDIDYNEELMTFCNVEGAYQEWFCKLKENVDSKDLFSAWKPHNLFRILPRVFAMLNECLVMHRWPEVLKMITCVNVEPKFTTNTIWRVGMELMFIDPAGNKALVDKLTNELRSFCEVDGKEVLLEYCMYLLTQNMFEEAKCAIRRALQVNRGTKRITDDSRYIDVLVIAYHGLLSYVEWLTLKKKQELRDSQEFVISSDYTMSHRATYHNYEEQMRVSAMKAIASFKSTLTTSGVWDIFLTKYIQLLDFINEEDQALAVLKSYVHKNEKNPNAYRYLYEFQAKIGANDEERIETLSKLAERVPSHKLVIELCKLLKNSPVVGRLLFDMLDYPEWKDKLLPWQMLDSFVENSFKNTDCILVIEESWKLRQDWWPAYIFDVESIPSTNKELLQCKSSVASCVMMLGNSYSEIAVEFLNTEHMDIS